MHVFAKFFLLFQFVFDLLQGVPLLGQPFLLLEQGFFLALQLLGHLVQFRLLLQHFVVDRISNSLQFFLFLSQVSLLEDDFVCLVLLLLQLADPLVQKHLFLLHTVLSHSEALYGHL